MNSIRVIAAIVFLASSTVSIADVDSTAEIDQAKQATVDTCMKAAEERYGKARTSSSPRKASVGSKKGYKVSMQVGSNTNKKVTCYAFTNGEVTFAAK